MESERVKRLGSNGGAAMAKGRKLLNRKARRSIFFCGTGNTNKEPWSRLQVEKSNSLRFGGKSMKKASLSQLRALASSRHNLNGEVRSISIEALGRTVLNMPEIRCAATPLSSRKVERIDWYTPAPPVWMKPQIILLLASRFNNRSQMCLNHASTLRIDAENFRSTAIRKVTKMPK